MVDVADAGFVPVQAHGHARLAHVTAPAPERLVAAMAGRPARVLGIAIHRRECGPAEAAQRARMRLARVEEGMADAVAKVRRKVGEAQASEVGCGLAALRLKAGLSQKELGQRMGKLQPAIARWERNPTQMQMENAMAYCDAIGITMQEFHDAIRQTKDQTAAA